MDDYVNIVVAITVIGWCIKIRWGIYEEKTRALLNYEISDILRLFDVSYNIDIAFCVKPGQIFFSSASISNTLDPFLCPNSVTPGYGSLVLHPLPPFHHLIQQN